MFAQNLALVDFCNLTAVSLRACTLRFPCLAARSHHDQGFPSSAPRTMV